MHRIPPGTGTLDELTGREGRRCRNTNIMACLYHQIINANTVVSSFCALDTHFQLLGIFVCVLLPAGHLNMEANMPIPNQEKKEI